LSINHKIHGRFLQQQFQRFHLKEPWDLIWIIFNLALIRSISITAAQEASLILWFQPKIKLFTSHKSIFRWIFSCQVRGFLDLVKGKESFNYQKEHGQCGQTVSKIHMTMEQEVFKLMVCILLLLFNANKKLSLLVSFLEILMHSHLF
jgi:hypothetical protein